MTDAQKLDVYDRAVTKLTEVVSQQSRENRGLREAVRQLSMILTGVGVRQAVIDKVIQDANLEASLGLLDTD
jgi:hypothetical protein